MLDFLQSLVFINGCDNDNRVRIQGEFVSQPRVRWLINIVLILAVVAFLGVSLIPLITTSFEQSQPPSQATPTASQTPVADQKALLEDEARGYELVLEQEPENQIALQSLAQAKIKLGNLDEAIAPLKKLVELYPNQTEYSLVLGQVYATQKNYDNAIAAYNQAIETNQQDFRPVLAKAVIFKQQGKTEQAKSLFEKAAAVAPAQYKEQINQLATEGTAAKEEQGKQKKAGEAEGAGGAGGEK